MRVGRSEESARIDAVLEAAAAGHGGSLVVVGPPGQGKTTLLLDAVERAGDAWSVLALAGYESERDLPWAGLTQLAPRLRPPGLALEVDGVVSTVLGGATPPDPPARLTAFLAVLEAIAHLAATRPVVLVADDLHWLDAETGACLAFIARRLEGLRVALLASRREGKGDPFPAELELPPLSAADADALIRSVRDVATPVRGRLVAALEGNPLALSEVVRSLTEDQCSGASPLPDPLPSTGALEEAFAARFALLPDATRAAVLVLAVSQQLGGEVARIDPTALVPAEAIGLVELGGASPRFRHPLMRSAVYWSAPAAERRQVHHDLALVQDEPVASAWHRAAAALGPDAAAAQDLADAAQLALRRGAHISAATALARAAELEPDPDQASGIRVMAVEAYLDGGDLMTARLLVDAVGRTGVQSLGWRRVRARLDARVGADEEATDRAVALADDLEATDPLAASRVLLEAAARYIPSGRVAEAIRLVDRLNALPTPPEPLAGLARCASGALLVLQGDRDAGLAMLRDHEGLLDGPDAPVALAAGLVPTALGYAGAPDALAVVERFFAAAAERGDMLAMPYLHLARSLALYRSDAAGGFAAAADAVAAADDLGLPVLAEGPLATMVATGAMVGDAAAVTRAAARLAVGAELGSTADQNVRSGLGLIALLEGRYADTLEQLMPLFEWEDVEFKVPLVYYHDVGEAAARLGDVELAQRAARRLRELDDLFGGMPWTQGVASRVEAMLLPVDECGDLYERSIELLLQVALPFGAGRTALLWGEQLRRARRRAEARGQLSRARDFFEEVGASGWAARASRELAAAGGASSADAQDTAARLLTPQQLEVARWIAAGLSYRDIAARLIVSPRTVEAHASAVYRRLGVRNRAELSARASTDNTLAGG